MTFGRSEPGGWKEISVLRECAVPPRYGLREGGADMTRSDMHRDAMLRRLGVTYYESLYGKATAADVSRALDSVAGRTPGHSRERAATAASVTTGPHARGGGSSTTAMASPGQGFHDDVPGDGRPGHPLQGDRRPDGRARDQRRARRYWAAMSAGWCPRPTCSAFWTSARGKPSLNRAASSTGTSATRSTGGSRRVS